MATSWAFKRQLLYGGIVIFFSLSILGFIFFKIFYKAPTCTDGVKNGDEVGVDCGGSCSVLCKDETIKPIVLWSKFFNISGNLYSIVAYVNNPNLYSVNPKADYEFKIYDQNNTLIESRKGSTQIPKNTKFAILEPGFDLKDKKPKYVDFSFTSFSPWIKDMNKDPNIDINHSILLSTSTTPKITGSIRNNSLEDISYVEMVAFVVDGKENVVASSKTFVENLSKKSSQDFVFTWPKPFNLGVEACVNNVNIALALDVSGSMRSESVNPPEPFDTVKNTAINFVKNLTDNSKVSVVSFGTNASKESSLSLDKESVQNAISGIFLSTSTPLLNTNIMEALKVSEYELVSQSDDENKKVIILLTDGVPTEPKKIGEPDYPKISAENLSNKIRKEGIDIYTIGLGKDINEGFLKNISGDDKHYLYAPNKETLSDIYWQLRSAICVKKPNQIIINYRIL